MSEIIKPTPIQTPEIADISERRPERPEKSKDIFQRLIILDHDVTPGLGFHGGSKKRSGLKLALWTWLSATIDTCVLISASCFFMVIFSFMMKTSPGSLLALFLKQQNASVSIAILFLTVSWTYLVFMRAFMGASIGEMTCDLRLGEPLQRLSISYILKVMLRTTAVMLTGVVLLPLVSLLLTKDIAGEISGLKMYSLE